MFIVFTDYCVHRFFLYRQGGVFGPKSQKEALAEGISRSWVEGRTLHIYSFMEILLNTYDHQI